MTPAPGEGPVVETDVLVVGSGPAGAAAALFLATYGTRTMMVTKYGRLSDTPRAHITNQRTMETLRDMGLEERLMREATPVGVRWATPRSAPAWPARSWAASRPGAPTPARHADYELQSPCTMLDAPQTITEPVLVQAAQARGAKVRFDTEYLSHTQDADGVTTRVRDRLTGAEYTIRSKYLVGADGARSKVAADLGPAVRGAGRGGRRAGHHLRGRPVPLRRAPALGPVLDAAAGRREGRRRARRAADDQALARVDADVGLRGRRRAARVHRRVRPRAGGQAGRHRRLRDAGDLRPRRGRSTTTSRPPSPAAGCSAPATPCTGTRRRTGWARTPRSRTPTTWPGSCTTSSQGLAAPSLLDTYDAERAPVARQIVERANQSIADTGRILAALDLDRHHRRRQARPAARAAQGAGPGRREDPAGAARGDRLQGLRVRRPRRRAQPPLRLGRRRPGRHADAGVRPRPGAVRPADHLAGRQAAAHLGHPRRRTGSPPSTWPGTGSSASGPASAARPGSRPRRAGRARPGLAITPVSIGPGQPFEDPYGTWADLREISDGGVLLVRPDLYIAARQLAAPLCGAGPRLAGCGTGPGPGPDGPTEQGPASPRASHEPASQLADGRSNRPIVASMTVQDLDTTAYAGQWEQWHRQHEAQLADPHGFLAITGLHWLTDDRSASPMRRAPGEPARRVTVELDEGEDLILDGAPVTRRVHLRPDPRARRRQRRPRATR